MMALESKIMSNHQQQRTLLDYSTLLLKKSLRMRITEDTQSKIKKNA